jgi:hypothetical protein
MSRLYVYALADSPGAGFRMEGHTIEFQKVGSVYAAVERIAERPPVTEAALRSQHAIVSRLAQESEAVLPARFGSLVDGAELERVIERRKDAVSRALDLVRGRAQMTVRVTGDEAGADTDGTQASGIASRRATLAPGPKTGTQYLQERKAAAQPRLEPEVIAAIHAAVEPLAVASRAEPGNGRTLATLYHLIDRGADREYREAMAAAERRLRRYVLAVTGPWAAFAFAPELWT